MCAELMLPDAILIQTSSTHDERILAKPFPPPCNLPVIARLTIGNSPLLEQCAICYKMSCAMRRNGELSARPDPPHISKFNEGEYELLPTSYGFLNVSAPIIITTIFASSDALYPEFATFSADETHGMFTTYLSVDVVDHFFDDCPNTDSGSVHEAKKVLARWIEGLLPSSSTAFRNALDDAEFHAVMILAFWMGDCTLMRDGIAQVADRYRRKVLLELQAHYRDNLKLKDVTARIGELFMLMFNLERGNQDCEEIFEIYRMLGVFTEDTFVYRLHDRSK